MNEHIEHQIIEGSDGKPLFAVIPYDEYKKLIDRRDREVTIPHKVVGLNVIEGKSMVRAWREYKKVTQKKMAAKMGISQAAYSQMEKPEANLRRATLDKIATALGINVEQLTE
jgi:DNA-binding XRE family transcriptional regulator